MSINLTVTNIVDSLFCCCSHRRKKAKNEAKVQKIIDQKFLAGLKYSTSSRNAYASIMGIKKDDLTSDINKSLSELKKNQRAF